jgi:hypothetical protein
MADYGDSGRIDLSFQNRKRRTVPGALPYTAGVSLPADLDIA